MLKASRWEECVRALSSPLLSSIIPSPPLPIDCLDMPTDGRPLLEAHASQTRFDMSQQMEGQRRREEEDKKQENTKTKTKEKEKKKKRVLVVGAGAAGVVAT